MRGRAFLALAVFCLAGACAHAPAAQSEQSASASPCIGDARQRVREADASARFKTAYAGFDAHMLAFNNHLQTGVDVALRLTYPQGMERFAALYDYADEAVERLGTLMPLETDETGAPSLAALADQIYEDAIRDPGDEDREALLRAAMAREIIAATPDAGRRTLDFLHALDMTRLLLKETSEGGNSPTSRRNIAALRDAGHVLDETYKTDFRPLLEAAIADPDTDELAARLASRLARLCAARTLCMTKGEKACSAGSEPVE